MADLRKLSEKEKAQYNAQKSVQAEKYQQQADATQSFGRGLLGLGTTVNGFMPVTGDIQSGLLALNDVKNKDYGSAALNGLGLLPFVPSMGGIIKSIPSPAWKKSQPSIKVGINPTPEEIELLKNIERTSVSGSGYGDLRVLMPEAKGSGENYFWPASDALHADIGNYYKLNPKNYKHGILEGD